jgi:hypothetical protein
MAQRDPIEIQTLQYARPSDFCKVFHDDMRQLYQLAYLLTADPQKAEQCFVAGLENAMEGSPVFKNWAQSWSKRTVIKNAIRMIAPLPRRSGADPTQWHATNTVVKLEPFERFVFVLSVLESYPDRECASLLNCRKQDVVAARMRVLQQFGSGLASSPRIVHPPSALLSAMSPNS